MAASLEQLIAAIPVAEDGNVITRDYHNSVRAAILAIVNQLGTTTAGGLVTTTFAPTFSPNAPQPTWVITQGVASRSDQTVSDGWLPLMLPDGVRIRRMILRGGRTGTVSSFQVQMIRQSLDDPTANITLISLLGLNTPALERDPFEAAGVPQVAGITSAAALNEVLTVDNSDFKYIVRARIVNPAADAAVRIYGIKVEYTR